jgi:hypothetical protein
MNYYIHSRDGTIRNATQADVFATITDRPATPYVRKPSTVEIRPPNGIDLSITVVGSLHLDGWCNVTVRFPVHSGRVESRTVHFTFVLKKSEIWRHFESELAFSMFCECLALRSIPDGTPLAKAILEISWFLSNSFFADDQDSQAFRQITIRTDYAAKLLAVGYQGPVICPEIHVYDPRLMCTDLIDCMYLFAPWAPLANTAI